jgi:hypothetical protein
MLTRKWTLRVWALVLQQKTRRPVQFEITEPARDAVLAWIAYSRLKSEDFLFPSRIHASPHPIDSAICADR